MTTEEQVHQSHIIALQLEVRNVDTQLQTIENSIQTLLQKQTELTEQKKKLQRNIHALQETTKKTNHIETKWDNDDFEWSERLQITLKERFHLRTFRPLQKEAVNVTLSGLDCILIMPTGGGKSLCFHLPTLLCDGFSLIITPLVSLMEDQMLALNDLNIPAAILNASIKVEITTEIQKQMASKEPSYKLLYVTPEKLAKSKRFMSHLEKAHAVGNINRIVIDEVHCTSHWGHDFRPDYKFLGILKRMFPRVPILGLTATASEKILTDVKDILNLGNDCVVFRSSFNRPNLTYEVHKTSANQVDLVGEIAKRIKDEFPKQSGIIYCFSRKDSEDVASLLTKHGISASCYHAELTGKSYVHKAWMKDKVQVVVATIAFGMGIDKPDVRFVIHYSISKSMENYYQESGRAGHDEKPAKCILYFRFNDIFRQSSMVFNEKTGLPNLYKMLNYCLVKSECRRNLIGECFGEHWPASKCNESCDNCIRKKKHDIFYKDLKSDAVCIIEIITNAQALQERVTSNMVIDAWMRKEKPKIRQKQRSKYNREECESILTVLLINHILEEDYHFTPHSTVTYLIPGPGWLLLKRGQINVTMDMTKDKCIDLEDDEANTSVVISDDELTEIVEVNTDRITDLADEIHKISLAESVPSSKKVRANYRKRKVSSSSSSSSGEENTLDFVVSIDADFEISNQKATSKKKQPAKKRTLTTSRPSGPSQANEAEPILLEEISSDENDTET